MIAGDLGLRQALGTTATPASAAIVARTAERWRPFRGYATLHIWTKLLTERTRDGHRSLA